MAISAILPGLSMTRWRVRHLGGASRPDTAAAEAGNIGPGPGAQASGRQIYPDIIRQHLEAFPVDRRSSARPLLTVELAA